MLMLHFEIYNIMFVQMIYSYTQKKKSVALKNTQIFSLRYYS